MTQKCQCRRETDSSIEWAENIGEMGKIRDFNRKKKKKMKKKLFHFKITDEISFDNFIGNIKCH